MGKVFSKKINRKKIGTRERRLSVSMEEDSILPGSAPGDSFVITQAGVEFSKIKINQDAYFVNEDRTIFAVFDGHGRTGHHCSKFVRDHLGDAVEKRSLTLEGICDAMVDVSNQMEQDETIDSEFSGTTVLAVVVTADNIISAWLGDSRAVMGRLKSDNDGSLGLIELTHDHKPDLPTERRRILKAGGQIRQLKDENGRKCGPLRVFKPSSTVPGVNFSRSMGDKLIHKYGVSAEVQCLEQPRTRLDRFIVVASDGVFEFLSNMEVIEIVSKCDTVETAAKLLSAEARKRWLSEEQASDDITTIIIKLH